MTRWLAMCLAHLVMAAQVGLCSSALLTGHARRLKGAAATRPHTARVGGVPALVGGAMSYCLTLHAAQG